ncbi:MipA/OmpV family protein [Jannaschia ovalis]|uniref:MipA/OmpV family protein n=1 Tax=Jannaschia ovalis TaxID=3038773 RepID=A0ABY8LEL3_9RHOB|nr:MipA/OmpV family protein [Jannaschia sp. GRR-S6-38]WGH79731.1 MipA/OmpV family protein [Jannaschia sp. GRR-S6-38]
MPRLTALIAAMALAIPAAASAQSADGTTILSTQGTGPALGFTLRGGVASTPEYFGAPSNELGPDIGFELNYLRFGNFTIGNPDPLFRPQGFGVTGSFRYIGERDDADSPELAGLNDIDAALELGLGLQYAADNYQVFGAVRRGVTGHDGLVGELGADLLLYPTDRLTVTFGPRALWGDDEYASTYFGVTAAEAGASAFTAFAPSGGLMSVGVELGAGYRLNDRWGIEGAISYDKLQNDAAASPITADDESLSARIGVTRRFTLGF